MDLYKIYINDRNYSSWEVFEMNSFKKIDIKVDPCESKLFSNDVFSFTPLNIYNGTLLSVPQDVKWQPLPINQMKDNPPQEDCSISNVHRCITLSN